MGPRFLPIPTPQRYLIFPTRLGRIGEETSPEEEAPEELDYYAGTFGNYLRVAKGMGNRATDCIAGSSGKVLLLVK
jgi:hypothetical protein